MAMDEKLRLLRQEKSWTQADLADEVSVHQKQISSYERGVISSSTEVLIKLAEVLDVVTLDYLAFDAKGAPGKLNLHDREFLRRFKAVDGLPDTYRSLAKEMLDLLVLKHRFQVLAAEAV